jgi:hypothetical protein
MVSTVDKEEIRRRLGLLLIKKISLVLSAHFVLTYARLERTSQSVTHPQVAPGQARLTSELFEDEFFSTFLHAINQQSQNAWSGVTMADK